jgi:hypothetical protein
MAGDDVTVEILQGIRDEIRGLRADTNQRFDETNERLDRRLHTGDSSSRSGRAAAVRGSLHEGHLRARVSALAPRGRSRDPRREARVQVAT